MCVFCNSWFIAAGHGVGHQLGWSFISGPATKNVPASATLLILLTPCRFTAGHAKRYVNKVHAQHRRGEAPPGQIDSAKVDWSGVGAR